MKSLKQHIAAAGTLGMLALGAITPLVQDGLHLGQASASTSAQEVVNVAHSYLGARYSYAGTNALTAPKTGFTCVTFVQWVFHSVGINIPLSGGLSALYNFGTPVARASLQPGDMVFFQGTAWAGLSHVSIYIGNNQVIGADNPQLGVHKDNLSDSYWSQHYLGARRIAGVLGGQMKGSMSNAATDNKVTVNFPAVNVRSGSGINHGILGVAHKGQVLQVKGAAYGWVEVNWNGKNGWIYGGLVSKS